MFKIWQKSIIWWLLIGVFFLKLKGGKFKKTRTYWSRFLIISSEIRNANISVIDSYILKYKFLDMNSLIRSRIPSILWMISLQCLGFNSTLFHQYRRFGYSYLLSDFHVDNSYRTMWKKLNRDWNLSNFGSNLLNTTLLCFN